jgi:hypothetical protein
MAVNRYELRNKLVSIRKAIAEQEALALEMLRHPDASVEQIMEVREGLLAVAKHRETIEKASHYLRWGKV